ncbi:MAG: NUDIX domain-containing protein [Acidobacteria bacterium]|nr:NUDIX domain-containing protein [Acidobacteriota bacterium]MBK8312684.1 NUDIX domain-containing protein [Acidobacteriota bacterium]MBK9706832.1 NUDIX domain-containing protein [Acidobacteriota bacterium]
MNKSIELDYCAGGIVWRETEKGREVLLILSRDDRAWKFPKGHIDADDPSWVYAAQREVREETGYDTRITDFAGFTKYPVNGKTKVVFYWHMESVGESNFEPSDEIEGYGWFTIREALLQLTFLSDIKMLLQFTPDNER